MAFLLNGPHWHTTRNLRCEITGPGVHVVVPRQVQGRKVTTDVPQQPGSSAHGIELWQHVHRDSVPSIYEISWKCDVENRQRPLTLAKRKWDVL